MEFFCPKRRSVPITSNLTIMIDEHAVGPRGGEVKPLTPVIMKERDVIGIHAENAGIDQERVEKIEIGQGIEEPVS